MVTPVRGGADVLDFIRLQGRLSWADSDETAAHRFGIAPVRRHRVDSFRDSRRRVSPRGGLPSNQNFGERRQPRRTYGRAASTSTAEGARRGPSPSSTGGIMVTPQAGSFFRDPRPSGGFSSGPFHHGATIKSVPPPIASATTRNGRRVADT